MAPRPDPVPDATALLNNLISALSSIFKARPRTRRPIFSSSPEGADSMELKDWLTPPLLPPPSPDSPISPSEEQPTSKWELKPPGPEKESWLGDESLQHTDEYDELVSNRWEVRKRTVQYSEHPAMAMGGRVPEGEYRLTYSQELSLVVFIFLVTVFAGAAGISALGKLDRKLRRCLTHRLGKLEKDQRSWAALYYVLYGAVTLGLWIIMLSGVFCLQQLLEAAIWG